jgi:hypothetical protein
MKEKYCMISSNKYKHEGMYFNTNWTYNLHFQDWEVANVLLPCDEIYKITIGITFIIIIKECYVKIKGLFVTANIWNANLTSKNENSW